jgi:hypothetical protein
MDRGIADLVRCVAAANWLATSGFRAGNGTIGECLKRLLEGDGGTVGLAPIPSYSNEGQAACAMWCTGIVKAPSMVTSVYSTWAGFSSYFT